MQPAIQGRGEAAGNAVVQPVAGKKRSKRSNA
jgi:hypothetical protein